MRVGVTDTSFYNCNPLGVGNDKSRFNAGLSLRKRAAYNGTKLDTVSGWRQGGFDIKPNLKKETEMASVTQLGYLGIGVSDIA